MKSLLALVFILMNMNSVRASNIEISSNDCNFEKSQERDGINLRVSKIIAVENSLSAWDIDLPSDKIQLPLKEGTKIVINDESDEEIIISYKNGFLIHDHKALSNFSRDTLELAISPDLKHIRSAKFTRKGTGILSLFGSEKFECKF
ncbi:MAG: hypothetical protein ACJ76H_07745 [Bacteriovoracaceae bacterium]